ncbi:ABC transporter substrate-binding protein [Demequina capsici]|uniref:ABC transporter substrate-binding protein n=2 Tax=Demequina capsici TaxID=3075620 RepID=A0AA96JBS4_9MICO|nr:MULTISPECIES: ABC transporter substrate-binding protein [unclassified Demequina]WNM26026.1 ABC transporter substrate-binding protein [Demequina sp. OYTSA14]WNM28900.1 ABC transporter substrate-binding protein [Demequina sp. PMTSA13]
MFALTACSSDGGDTSPSTSETAGSGSSSAIIMTNGSEPENPLIPGNTNETGGGKILDSIFAGLVYYDATGAVHNEVAESIVVSDDAMTVDVTLQDGWTFTNGEPVTASSFVDAWNYTAQASNAYLNSYYFEDIDGFSYDEDSALNIDVTDDLNFTIHLNKPAADFAQRLGYTAFMPLPTAFYDDPEAYGENPIGDGPYMLAGDGAWQHNVQIDLVTNPDYKGGRTPQNGGVTFVFYASQDAAYADLLQNNVDVIDGIPDSSLATYQTELGDRAVNQAAAIFQSFTIPESLPHFSGEEGKLRRQALSMAIDRPTITNVIFNDTRTPASDFTSPVVDGFSDTLTGADVLSYNPDKAVELWAEADAISPWDGTFGIAYNSDGGHQAWVDAVANSIKNVLGIDAEGAPYATFKELRSAVNDRTITTAFRTGWQADYPGLYNFLGPLYKTDAGSNDGDYSNPEFDALLEQGISTADNDARNALLQQAQEILLQDLPAIPLWYSNVDGGFSENVSNVTFGWNSVPLYYEITKSA